MLMGLKIQKLPCCIQGCVYTKDVVQGGVQCFDKGNVQRNVRRYVLQSVVVGYVQIVK